MTLLTAKGSFTKGTGADNSTQQVTIGFQPKAIWFWVTHPNQTSEGYLDGFRGSIGFCDGTAVEAGNRCVTWTSDDGGAASDTAKNNSDIRCIQWAGAGGVLQQASYVSAIDSTSFTLTHSTNQAIATIIQYFAIGGDAITDTAVDTFACPTLAGSQSITSLAFRPDFIFLITSKQSTIGPSSVHYGSGIGFATGPSNEGAIFVDSEDARNPSDTWRWQRTDRILALLVTSSGAAAGEAELTQFTANGFDLNWLVGNDSTGLVFVLAVKGGNPFVSSLLQPTSTGVQTYNTLAEKTPKGVMMFSTNNVTSSTIDSNCRLSVGATDGTNEGLTWIGDTDNVTPVVVASRTVLDKAIGMSTEAATASSSTTDAEADTDSFNLGNFKLNWTTVDATQREVLFFSFSESTYPRALIIGGP